MILVEKIFINKIPALHIVKEEVHLSQLPFVIFVHGFGSFKEKNLHYAYLLAEKGFRVVLPEALYHGERANNQNQQELAFRFWEIVLKTIHELEGIKNYFLDKGLIDEERIGLAGTSMGGIITHGALTQYKWIKVAASLMGSPYYLDFAKRQMKEVESKGISLPITDVEQEQLLEQLKRYDLSLQSEKLGNRPIFLWHGKVDPVVPFEYSSHFYEMMVKRNAQIDFLVDEKAGHKVSHQGLLRMVDWFHIHFSLKVETHK
ncbi:prolyl oligopeptidase family serine peptidase [Pseudoneobacillus sp. C159]